MKKFLVGAVATAAMMTPAIASADTNAVVGLQYANTDIDSFDFDSYGFNGAFSHDLNNGWFLQVDGEYNRVDAGGCCFSNSYAGFHAGMRNDSHAFAGFVSLGDFFGYSGLGVGVEGSLYWSNIVLNGSLGHVDFGDIDLSATGVSVDGSYFFNENLAINALVAYGDAEDGIDADWTTLGIGGEWRMANSPTSFTLGYRNTDFDSDFDSDTWTIGVNFDLGTGSLRERASNGPSMNGARSLNSQLDAFLP